MTPTRIRASVVTERVAWVRQMVSQATDLPLASLEIFIEDARNAGAAESFLRRGIEALLDIGRHILAKGFAIAVTEYKEIGVQLVKHGVLGNEDGKRMRRIAGYRNRMVHFYNAVTTQELYLLITQHIEEEKLVSW
jgi:uncharacterized protein YutE (UPF0331/DUF86 family)